MSISRHKKNTLKIVVVGDSGVGKTCLMQRYMTGGFSSEYRTTVGADFLSTKITNDDTTYSLQIWDTAGQEKFQAIGSAFYRGSDCCIVVFDVSNRKSFENIGTWMNEFKIQGEVDKPDSFPFVIFGNKCDKLDRAVSTDEAKQCCESKGLIYFETSAKDDIGIKEAFEVVVQKAIARNSQSEQNVVPTGGVVTLAKTKQQKPKEDCSC